MRKVLLAAALPLLLLSGCGSGNNAPTPTPVSDPAAAVRQAADATAELESFHLDLTFTPLGEPIVYSVDYEDGNYIERIPDRQAGGYSDYVFYGDSTYRIDCSAEGVCGAWQRQPGRLVVPNLAGSANTVPETLAPFIARMMTDVTRRDPASMTFEGMADVTAATIANLRQAFALAGNTPDQVEAAIEQQFGDRRTSEPSVVEITLTPDAHYIQHLVVYTPTQPDNPYIEFAYSYHNAVRIQPPQ
jgi:hypothetical protein